MTQALQALFLAFPAQERDGSEREMAMIYRLAVDGIPAGFVAMACKRFIQGQVIGASVTFRPAPPELASETRRLRDKALDNQRLSTLRLPKPAEAEVPDPTPEERQRCADLWAKAKAQIQHAAQSMTMPRNGRDGSGASRLATAQTQEKLATAQTQEIAPLAGAERGA